MNPANYQNTKPIIQDQDLIIISIMTLWTAPTLRLATAIRNIHNMTSQGEGGESLYTNRRAVSHCLLSGPSLLTDVSVV